jgi:hypothetical protein
MSIKTYRISFIVGGKTFWEVVQAYAPHDAIQLLKQRYPGATSFSWQQVG